MAWLLGPISHTVPSKCFKSKARNRAALLFYGRLITRSTFRFDKINYKLYYNSASIFNAFITFLLFLNENNIVTSNRKAGKLKSMYIIIIKFYISDSYITPGFPSQLIIYT